MWERNREYKGNRCLVCGKRTRELVAPMGIASGSFPCCNKHEDRQIMRSYFDWCSGRLQFVEAHEERSS